MDTDTQNLLAGGMVLMIAMVFFIVIFAIQIFVCWVTSSILGRVPPQFRKQEPGMVWLLLIPCVSIVWNFFVYPRVAQSLKGYFNSIGRTDVGDCGEGIGLGYSICAACALLPYFNILAGPAALVLLIIFLVKANGLKNEIPLDAALSPSAPGPLYPPYPPA